MHRFSRRGPVTTTTTRPHRGLFFSRRHHATTVPATTTRTRRGGRSMGLRMGGSRIKGSGLFSSGRRHQDHHHTTAAAPMTSTHHHQKRHTSIGDKISGALLRLKGSLTGRRGQKGAGTRRMHGTDGRGVRRRRFF
ncbi:hypothetical protein B0I37DRAFT_355606 [Chaetomium sp. MPI-CAGE-AT-0009]|nr:hypothetical protein B0I37DRAFT_355606 [Chaetomium sp. MPI-CAGE-AT-0009]